MGILKAGYAYLNQDGEDGFILYIHGLFLFGLVMKPLAKRLGKQGFSGALYDYPTRIRTVSEHGKDLAEILEKMPEHKIHVITHSMGGLIFRSAIAQKPELAKKIGRAVLLAPPNRGSAVASWYCRNLFFAPNIIHPLRDMREESDAWIHHLYPIPEIEFGVVGALRDQCVAMSNTHLPTERDHITVDSSHTRMLFLPETAHYCKQFLKTGHFSENGDA